MTGPLELKKITYNIFFELLVLLAIHGRFYLFASIAYYQPFFVAQICAPKVSSPVSKLEITRLLQPLYVFKSSRAHLRVVSFAPQ